MHFGPEAGSTDDPTERPEQVLGRLLAVREELAAQMRDLKIQASAVDDRIQGLTGDLREEPVPEEAGTAVIVGPRGRHTLILRHPGTTAFVESMRPLGRLSLQERLVLHTLVDEYLATGRPVRADAIAQRLGYAEQTVAVSLSWLRGYGFPDEGEWTVDIPGNGEYRPCPRSACQHPPQRRRLPRAGRKAA